MAIFKAVVDRSISLFILVNSTIIKYLLILYQKKETIFIIFFIYNDRHLWKYNLTEAHYSIFTGRGSLKERPGAAFAAPVRTPMLAII